MATLKGLYKKVQGKMKSDERETSGKRQDLGMLGVGEQKSDRKVRAQPNIQSSGRDRSFEIVLSPPTPPVELPATVQEREQDSLTADIGSSKLNRQAPSKDITRKPVPNKEPFIPPPPTALSASIDKKSHSIPSVSESAPKEAIDVRISSTSSEDLYTSTPPSESTHRFQITQNSEALGSNDPQKPSPPESHPAVSLYLKLKKEFPPPSNSKHNPNSPTPLQDSPRPPQTKQTIPPKSPVPVLKVTVIGTDDSPENWAEVRLPSSPLHTALTPLFPLLTNLVLLNTVHIRETHPHKHNAPPNPELPPPLTTNRRYPLNLHPTFAALLLGPPRLRILPQIHSRTMVQYCNSHHPKRKA